MTFNSVLRPLFQFEVKARLNAAAHVYVLGMTSVSQRKALQKKIIDQHAPEHLRSQLLKNEKRTLYFAGMGGPVWILQNGEVKKGTHSGLLDESEYAWFRDQSGSLASHFKTHQLENVAVEFNGASENIVRAFMVGLELASYNFLSIYNQSDVKTPKLFITNIGKGPRLNAALLQKFQLEASAVQLARHLVNLPPNELNPETVEALVRKDLGFAKSVKIDVWDHKKLAAENMNLHLAVGQGSETPPRMVHIRYRPAKNKKPPLAFVGKGITFDTGGLDIKPSSAMRLMKKDMGGAAAVLGLAYWVIHSGYGRACDFYLALAENSVDAKAMRPGDLYRSRAGYLVEIDNTDAEGRLVLADVLDVAVTQKGADEPECVIDIATLTGAIKVALGADVAGLFTNDDQLAQQLQVAGQQAGDPNWRMPLVQKYFSSLSSHFADFRNSADGFGGAITAALFLEKYCRGKKWAHLDVYSWNDKNNGALTAVGGSGQPVQGLIEWLKRKA